MRVPRRAIILTALALLTSVALPCTGFAQGEKKTDVTGKWLFTVTTGGGSGTPTVTFKQAGDSLTGHYSSQLFGEVDFKGTVKDRQVTFSFSSSVQGTSVTVTYSGTVEGADAMKGKVDFGSYGAGTFTAKRQ